MKPINSSKLSRLYVTIFFVLSSLFAITQDLRSAYFQVKWLTGYTYSADLYIFTNLTTTTFRPYVLIGWGIGTDSLKFVDAVSYNNVVKSKYTGKCVYPGPSVYNVNIYENYRINNIKNIVNSQNEPIQFTNKLVVNTFAPPNNSPMFQNPPIYFTKSGNQVFYNPMFVDPDGDSLSYSLINCSVGNYYLPNGVSLSQTGVFSFSKDSIGNYAFSYKIDEWKKDFSSNYNYAGTSQFDFVIDINSSIGVNEINRTNEIIVYPNPVSNVLYVSSQQNKFQNTEIEITNALGQTVLKSEYKTGIDVSALSHGCYFFKIITPDKKTFYSKFIKE